MGGSKPCVLFEFISSISRVLSGSPIQRLHSFLIDCRRRVVSPASFDSATGAVCPMFPMHFPKPFVSAISLARGHAKGRWVARRTAWLIVEWCICFYNYFELGSPTSTDVFRNALGPWRIAPHQLKAVRGLYDELVPFCRLSSSEGLSRGRFTLKQSLDSL